MNDPPRPYAERQMLQIVQTDHAVGLWCGMAAGRFVEALSNMPSGAILIEIEGEGNSEKTLVFRSKTSSNIGGDQ